jgi:pSer/pThr/pTyr-binding forkhead associated (FHA) protein
MQPTLYIAEDDRVVALHEGVTRIGRSLTADLELEDMTVSRRHALIVRGEGKTVLLDDGSRNGVRLNGVRIDGPYDLKDGDMIALGRTQLRYAAAVRELTAA